MWLGRLNMTIAVDWDIKPKTNIYWLEKAYLRLQIVLDKNVFLFLNKNKCGYSIE